MTRVLRWLFAVLLSAAALLYAGDDLWARFRLARHHDVFDAVTVRPLYVIHEKNNKLEYQLAQPQNETCVRSLFPHFGDLPCWYLRKHSEKQIDI